MSLNTAEKQQIKEKYQLSASDTGSPEVQVALLTSRIKYLTEHFKVNKKDNHSRTGLRALVNRRRSLLKYLKRKEVARYRGLIQSLGLRDSY